MSWLKVIIGLWIVYAVGLFGTARLVSARLIANELGSIYLRNGDEYGTLPIDPGQCKATESEETCDLMVGIDHLKLDYKLVEPFQIQGYTVLNEKCQLTYAEITRTCETMWINHPARRVAYIDMTRNPNVDLIKHIQSKWPLENLSERTWMNLAMMNILPMGGLLWLIAQKLQFTTKQQIFFVGGIGLGLWQFVFMLALVMLTYLVD